MVGPILKWHDRIGELESFDPEWVVVKCQNCLGLLLFDLLFLSFITNRLFNFLILLLLLLLVILQPDEGLQALFSRLLALLLFLLDFLQRSINEFKFAAADHEYVKVLPIRVTLNGLV